MLKGRLKYDLSKSFQAEPMLREGRKPDISFLLIYYILPVLPKAWNDVYRLQKRISGCAVCCECKTHSISKPVLDSASEKAVPSEKEKEKHGHNDVPALHPVQER